MATDSSALPDSGPQAALPGAPGSSTDAPAPAARSDAAAGAGGGAGAAAGGPEAPVAGLAAGAAPLVPRSVLDAGVKLVVWDFDLTVLSIHSWGERIAAADVPTRNLAADFADLDTFMGVVDGLVAAGVHVAVASFGSYDTIQAYLDRVFPPGCFTRTNISTPTVVGGSDGCSVEGGKNPQLALLASQFGVKKHELLFFDDDRRNIDRALEAGYTNVIHTPGGFTKDVWEDVVRLVSK